MSSTLSPLFIGLMSGTSLDGVDAVLASFTQNDADKRSTISPLAHAYIPFPGALRAELLALQTSGNDELHREALASNALAQCYANCTTEVLKSAGCDAHDIRALGAHGQTVRHRPELGYTRQINNPALLAELTGIDVIADFRSRDVAASGQGAPLVPAFHQAVFGTADETRVVANIGGISNISVLHTDPDHAVTGFDTGPGNVLMDMWIAEHHDAPYDAGGAWAATGRVIPALLDALRDDPFFALAPPKSTGRDLFHADWLRTKLAPFQTSLPVDVQATLTAFTASTLADAIAVYAIDAKSVHVCGGGAYNRQLLRDLQSALVSRQHAATVLASDALGVAPNHVEALAFAWLAYRFTERLPGNLPLVTGARGPRTLGALYPA